jgi:hypothetical protein
MIKPPVLLGVVKPVAMGKNKGRARGHGGGYCGVKVAITGV